MFTSSKIAPAKAIVHQGKLPAYFDPQQPPHKKQPFCTVLSQPFIHTVEILLPETLCDLIWEDVSLKISPIQYMRVIMSLSEVLEGDFFNKYIKSGNVLMLSESLPSTDCQYTLRDGHLRLDLPRDVYERTGLQGKPIEDGGRKHVLARYAIDLDLRQPSMLHGKKGFERIVWAFKHVLNHSMTWLFYDFESNKDIVEENRPVAKHHPFKSTVVPHKKSTERVLVPEISQVPTAASGEGFDEWATDYAEWIALVSLQSPRVLASDRIDPYLSRYRVDQSDTNIGKSQNMVSLCWKGLIPAIWIRTMLITLCSAISKRATIPQDESFFALSAHAFITKASKQSTGYTILTLQDAVKTSTDPEPAQCKGRDFVLWETLGS